MSASELRQEIAFGLENLDKVFQRISDFAEQDLAEQVKVSALTYECLGYDNAAEHLIIRILKHLKLTISSGPFSHRDTLQAFERFVVERGIPADEGTLLIIENLMAFRHVATKIYGFLIDWNKLQSVINDIQSNHTRITQLIRDVEEGISV